MRSDDVGTDGGKRRASKSGCASRGPLRRASRQNSSKKSTQIAYIASTNPSGARLNERADLDTCLVADLHGQYDIPMRIVLCYPLQEQHLDQIRHAAPGANVVDAGQEGVAREILAADVFCGHAKVPVPWEQAVSQGRLKWIQSSAAGLDHCLVPCVIDSEIPVTSASGLFADQVAEQTMALLLGLVRRLPVFLRATKKGVRPASDQ